MGLEDLGYPGMMPLGQSYVLGQWILHHDIPADPNDLTLPAPDFIDGVYEAAAQQNLDKGAWLPADFAAHHAEAMANLDMVRGMFAAYQNNGPLPTDEEFPHPSGGDVWAVADNISRERHVFFYGVIPGTQSWAKFLQIQGFTLNIPVVGVSDQPGMWVLPRLGGQQVFGWRYAADHAGPPYDNTQWKGTFSMAKWAYQNESAMATWFTIIYGTALTVATAGAASVAVPAIIGAAAAIGIGLSTAEALAVLGIVDTLIIGVVKFALTGDSSGLMAGIADAAGLAVKMSPQAIAALKAQCPDAVNFVQNVGNQIQSIETQAQGLISAGAGALGAYVTAAQAQVGKFPLIDGNYWNLAKTAIGGEFAPGSYFFNLARMAPDLPSLTALENEIPDYAQGFLQFGATIRAAEMAQIASFETKYQGGQAVSMTNVYAASLHSSMNVSMPVSQQIQQPPKPKPPAIGPVKSPEQVVQAHAAASSAAPIVIAGGFGLAWLLGFL